MAYSGLAELENKITDLRKAAELFQKQGNTEAYQIALETLQASQDLIARLNPHSKLGFAAFFLNDGVEKEKKGDLPEALADYNQALRLNPNYADVYNLRGLVYTMSGDYQKAIPDLQRAATLFQQQGDTAKAEQALDSLKQVSLALPVRSLPVNAIAQSSSNASTAEDFVNRGIEKVEKEDLRGAIADFNEALRLNPNYADAYLLRGAAYGQLKEYQKEIADYNQALRLNPNDAEANYLRGMGYIMLGESQKGIADLQRAATLFQQQGDTATVQTILDLLKKLQQ